MTDYEDRPVAFVAMRFEDDHWKDKITSISTSHIF